MNSSFQGNYNIFSWGKRPDAGDFIKAGNFSTSFSEMTKWVENTFARKDIYQNANSYTVQFYLLPRLLSKPSRGIIFNSNDKFGRPYPLIEGENLLSNIPALEWEKYYIDSQQDKIIFNERVDLAGRETNDPDRMVFNILDKQSTDIFSILKICRLNIKRKPYCFFIFNGQLELFYRRLVYIDIVRIFKLAIQQNGE